MAKKALINKEARKPKFAVRGYTRCNRCGRPHSVYRKFGLCRICVREMAHRGELPGVTKSQLVSPPTTHRRSDAEGPQTGNHGEKGQTAMTMTDPIADMLTRLRNANTAYHDTVSMPHSKIKVGIAEILKAQGYIADWHVEDADGRQDAGARPQVRPEPRALDRRPAPRVASPACACTPRAPRCRACSAASASRSSRRRPVC